jgi:phage-related protein
MLVPRVAGASKDDYIAFPAEVQDEMGYALYQAQIGKTPRQAKVLKGFGRGGVIELRVRDVRSSNAYRTVYAANLEAAIYVLHAFQKKSTKGIKTSKRDIDMIDRRLRDARDIDRARAAEEENDDAR